MSEIFTLPPETDATGDAMQAHTRVWQAVKVSVELTAREATSNKADRKDLIQGAKLLLLELDATRINLDDINDVRVLRRALNRFVKGEAAKKNGEPLVRIEELPKEAQRVFR